MRRAMVMTRILALGLVRLPMIAEEIPTTMQLRAHAMLHAMRVKLFVQLLPNDLANVAAVGAFGLLGIAHPAPTLPGAST